jgi:hypothetical protein
LASARWKALAKERVMSIKTSELPDLIAAAVKHAIATKQITDETLQTLLHKPFTIGIYPEPALGLAERTEVVKLKPLGYAAHDLEALRNPSTLKEI